MKSKKKRVVTLVLAITMIFSSSVFSLQAFATDDEPMTSSMTEQAFSSDEGKEEKASRDADTGHQDEREEPKKDSAEDKTNNEAAAQDDVSASKEEIKAEADKTEDANKEGAGEEKNKAQDTITDLEASEEEEVAATSAAPYSMWTYYSLTIYKKNEDNEILSGATLELSGTEDTGDVFPREVWKSKNQGQSFSLRPGIYSLSEIRPPAGYDWAEDISIIVEQNGVIKAKSEGDSAYEVLHDGNLTMYDQVNTTGGKMTQVPITFLKTNPMGEHLKGADVGIFNMVTGELVSKWVTDGTRKKLKLEPGAYVYHEFDPPLGYDIAEDMKFEVTEDGALIGVESGSFYSSFEEEELTVIMCDKLDRIAQSGVPVTFLKVDEYFDLIKGAHLQLLTNDLPPRNEIVTEWVSDGTPHQINVRPGKYILRETLAPTGYEFARDIEFEITFSGMLVAISVDGKSVVDPMNREISMVDKSRTQEAVFAKADPEGNYLKGATLRIRDERTGEAIATWVTDGMPKTIALPDGDYVLEELKAPNGYETAPNVFFRMENGEMWEMFCPKPNRIDENALTITMVDEYSPHKVRFSKTDIGGEELEGATIELRNKESGEVVDRWVTDGTTKSFALKPGKYVFHEEVAPDGFLVATDITFEVTLTGEIVTTDVTLTGEDENTIVMVDDFVPEKPETPEKPKPEDPTPENPTPEKPSSNTPQKPEPPNSDTPQKKATRRHMVKTGDATAYTVYLLLMAGAATAVFGLRRYRKEKNKTSLWMISMF